uniref:Uncharacterized protein n=1 Tax=Candidatus Kentrum sp. FW TaxID=2126338 RepID=A0A450RUC6_9GAMM|nr:MAG: hypothetical protein BECKFW1821A_GA0114235_100255 [Candidatus Kentron sp. FW]
MQAEEHQAIKCASCGFVDSGRYCSNCGAELTDKSYGPVLNFIGSFLKFRELKDYIFTFLRILPSPTKNVIALYEESNSKKAFEFLAYSLAIYILIALSRVWIIKEHDLISTLIFTLQFILTISISMSVAFKLSSRKSTTKRTFHDFLVIASYFLGVNIVLIAIATSVQLIHLIAGTIVMWLFLIPLMIYTTRVLKYFWNLGGWTVIWHLSVGSFLGGTAGIGFLLLCGMFFDIQVRQY